MSQIKFTNNNNIPLPIAIYLATSNYEYDNDERVISATTLLKPTKAIHLARKYKDNQKEVDIADLASMVVGSSIHAGVERSLEPENIRAIAPLFGSDPDKIIEHLSVEKRTKKEINGYIISGQYDMAFKGTVCDVKSTSVWKYMLGDGKEYKRQMSIYKWLNPDIIKNSHGWIFYIFTDWSKKDYLQKSGTGYPSMRIASKEYELDDVDETERWILEKTNAIKAMEHIPDELLPDCTPEERWEKPAVWKYYKGESRVRSTANYDNPREAYARADREGGTVLEVKGESTGCKYCMVQNLCKQYEQLKLLGMV